MSTHATRKIDYSTGVAYFSQGATENPHELKATFLIEQWSDSHPYGDSYANTDEESSDLLSLEINGKPATQADLIALLGEEAANVVLDTALEDARENMA